MYRKIINVTRTDLDGAVCAALIKRAFINSNDVKVEAMFSNYDNVDHLIKSTLGYLDNSDRTLFLITDITPSKKVCKQLDEMYSQQKLHIQLLDHHITRSKTLKKYEWATFNNNKCGARLTYEFLLDMDVLDKSEALESLVLATDAWDRWDKTSNLRDRGENLNVLCHMLGLQEFANKFSENLYADADPSLSNVVKYHNNRRDRTIYKIISDQLMVAPYHMDDFGNSFKIIYSGEYVSELAHAVLNHPECEDLQYIVIADLNNNKLSLRSRDSDSINVGKLAKRLKGGGHNCAAGFNINFRSKAEKIIFNRLNKLDS